MRSRKTQLKNQLQISLLCLLIQLPVIQAQEVRQQPLSAPPPMRLVPHEERSQIDLAKDAKGRLRNTLELADAHLTKAEAETAQHDYDAASAELGKYSALIQDILGFLSPLSHDSNKTRDLYKRLELTLRANGPRLTSMRRTTPNEYAVWVKETEEFARNARTEALNSFYGHTVVRDGKAKPLSGSPSDKPTKDPATMPQSEQPQ